MKKRRRKKKNDRKEKKQIKYQTNCISFVGKTTLSAATGVTETTAVGIEKKSAENV